MNLPSWLVIRTLFILMCTASVHSLRASEMPIATLGDIAVYAQDMQADMLRIPENGRQAAASDPATVQQAAANLVLRKAMAEKAKAEQLDKDPAIQAQLQLLQQRFLSDVWLAKIDKASELTKAEIEKRAELKYQSEAFTRFKYPPKIKLRHILLPKNSEGKSKAEELLRQIKNGADFSELAKQHSIDPGSAASGGDLGLVTRGKMVPEFEEAAFALKTTGDTSPPVESNFGFHLIRLDHREEGKIAPYTEVKDGLIQEVITKHQNDTRNAAVASMFKQIKVSQEVAIKFTEAAKANKP